MSVLSRFDTPRNRKVSRWVVGLMPFILTAPLWINGLFFLAVVFWLQFTMIIAVFQYPWWSDEPLDVRLKYLHWMPWYISGVQRPVLLFMGKPRRLGNLSFTIGKVIMVSVATCFGLLMLYIFGLMLWDLAVHPASRKALEDRVGTDPEAIFFWVVFVRSGVIYGVIIIVMIVAWKILDYLEKKDRRHRASN